MFNIENYLNITDTVGYKNVKKNLVDLTKIVVNNFFADKPMFKESNFKYYYYDDFIFDTNNSQHNYITLYVEINQPKNVKNITSKKFKAKDKKVKDLHLTLQEIKDGLFDNFLLMFDQNTLLWQEQYSINMSINERVDGEKVNYLVRIIPCFTYENENKASGVIYYDNSLSKIEIEYPKLSINNFKQKNKDTNNLYYYYDIVIKNILMQERKENNIYFEIFESLLYNVPNTLFKDQSLNTLTQIINFLRNNNLKDYKTIDEQDYMFTSKYKSFSLLYVKHALGQIEKHIKKALK
ncbi:MAG: hypothetical protein IKB42_03380 [Clostridia bacterium]|nr:hypothetical protein [Clostridia bacterium]